MKYETEARAALKSLIRDAGGKAELARQLSKAGSMPLTPQALGDWEMIPLKWIPAAWKLYQKGLRELRPDVYQLANLHKDAN